jgi:hypothetical protein
MTNTISKPTWFYKTVDISDLDQIQQEFKKIIEWKYLTSFDDKQFGEYSSNYIALNKVLIEKYAPTFVTTLKNLNLFERWETTTISGTKNYSSKTSIVHVDDQSWERRCYALNIPIQNCHDSYTVWYDVKPQSGTLGLGQASLHKNVLGFAENNIIKEIARLAVSQPAFVNISIPHRPVTNHDELRLLISSRFTPEIHEYFI